MKMSNQIGLFLCYLGLWSVLVCVLTSATAIIQLTQSPGKDNMSICLHISYICCPMYIIHSIRSHSPQEVAYFLPQLDVPVDVFF